MHTRPKASPAAKKRNPTPQNNWLKVQKDVKTKRYAYNLQKLWE